MKAIAPVRTALGVRTVFNILGPLTNPAEPGYPRDRCVQRAGCAADGDALAGMPIRRAFVMHGAAGWDEPTPLGEFLLLDVRGGTVRESYRGPADYGLPRCEEAVLMGGDAAYNAAAMHRVLRGAEHGGHRDALILGAALALEVTGAVADPRAGAAVPPQAIDTGAASRLLEQLVAFAAGGGAS